MRYLNMLTGLAALALAGQAATAAEAAPSAGALPGGATSLRESYQDWQVSCAVKDKNKQCVMSQRQARKDGKRVLAIELRPQGDGLIGTLVLPFGLLLSDGVQLGIDDAKPATESLPFRTCVPAGCLVPVAFDTGTVKALRAGNALKLVAKSAGGDKPVQFSVSLKGFAGAADRIQVLLK
jgi:invasion protein IalB